MKVQIIIVLLILTSSDALFTSRLRSRFTGFAKRVWNRVGNPIFSELTRLANDGNSVCGPFQYLDLMLKECRGQCNDNQNCREDEICHMELNKCMNPCLFDPCEFSEPCYVHDHKNYCSCVSNKNHCTQSSDCIDDKTCYGGKCRPHPCQSFPCYDRRERTCDQLSLDAYECQCLNGQAFDMNHNCYKDGDCHTGKICYEGKCSPHPCQAFPCYNQHNKTCEASLTDPPKCMCKPGYEGNPADACYTGKDCRCAIGFYMSADRSVCHYPCGDNMPCRHGKTCDMRNECV